MIRAVVFVILALVFTTVSSNNQAQAGGAATPTFTYPNTSGNHYLFASASGNGIYLNAPISYLKARYNSDAAYFDINITDACYYANIDGGSSKPGGCRSGDVNINVCASDNNGEFNSGYKGNGAKCYQTDPASWSGSGGTGTGTRMLRFKNQGAPGTAWPLDMPDVGGRRFLFVIVTMGTPGANAFKVQSVARNSSLAAAGDTRIGLGGQLTHPLAVGYAPLASGASETFQFDQKIPCAPARNSFQVRWFDADRPPSGIPNDTDINWEMRNQTTGHTVSSDQYAFFRTGGNTNEYMGGQDADRGETIANNGLFGVTFRVQAGDSYRWSWRNVDRNNGVQVKLPFAEVDDLSCQEPTITVALGDCETLTFRADTSTGAAYDARLIVDGVDRTLMQNIPDNQERSFDISAWSTAEHTFSVRARDTLSGIAATSEEISNVDCLGGGGSGPSCPTFVPIIRTESLPQQGMPASTDASRHKYNGTTSVRTITDQWGQQADWTGGNNGSVDVDYTPYARDYPYDVHNPTIYYTNYYTTDHYEYEKVGTNTYSHTHDGSTHSHTDDVYDWVYKSTSGPHATSEQTTAATAMDPECYFRRFDTTMDYGTVAWDDVENPSSITFTIDFETEYRTNTPGVKPLREQNRVRLPVTTTITLYHADGTSQTYPTSGTCGGGNALINNNFTTTPSSNFNTVNDASTNCRPVSFPTLRVGDYACVAITLTHGSGDMNHSGVIQTGGASDTLQPSPHGVGRPGCTQKIVNRPYLNVSKGDVLAGACSTFPTAGISSWYTANRGAGTTLAAYALGAIDGFTSAATRGSNPLPTRGLSFGNEDAPFGGDWNAEPSCMTTSIPPGTAFAGGSLSGLTDGVYSATGNITITTSSISTGRQIVISTTGDVRIDNDIRINPGNTYATVRDIPSVRIIARNIYIDPTVENLDAILIAEADTGGAGGNILTCTHPTSNTRPSAEQAVRTVAENADSCQRKLTIRGALNARKIFFLRTNGSLRSGSNTDYTYGGSANTAEHIIFSPSSWLSTSPVKREGDSPYKAYTNLPPIL